jgi:hypothetical protein
VIFLESAIDKKPDFDSFITHHMMILSQSTSGLQYGDNIVDAFCRSMMKIYYNAGAICGGHVIHFTEAYDCSNVAVIN